MSHSKHVRLFSPGKRNPWSILMAICLVSALLLSVFPLPGQGSLVNANEVGNNEDQLLKTLTGEVDPQGSGEEGSGSASSGGINPGEGSGESGDEPSGDSEVVTPKDGESNNGSEEPGPGEEGENPGGETGSGENPGPEAGTGENPGAATGTGENPGAEPETGTGTVPGTTPPEEGALPQPGAKPGLEGFPEDSDPMKFFAASPMRGPAQAVDASTFGDLKNALANATPIINITGNITLTDTEELNDSAYDGKTLTINGGSHTLTGSGLASMFHFTTAADININALTMDGSGSSRHINAESIPNLTLTGCTFQNGSSKSDSGNAEGGSIRLIGGSLSMEGCTFSSNQADDKTSNPLTAAHGGAIYSNKASLLELKGCTFKNNSTGINNPNNTSFPYGCGGAIAIDGCGNVQESNCTYEGNHCAATSDKGGSQGGCIFLITSTMNSTSSRFTTAYPFNTGGAIYSRDSTLAIDRGTFTVPGDPGQQKDPEKIIGISGGAIQLNSNVNCTITNSQFTEEDTPHLQFAGGFINVASGALTTLNIDKTTFTGTYKFGDNDNALNNNNKGLAKFGGAICFEEGSIAKSLISNCTIENVAASNAGGAINIGTAMSGKTTVDLTLNNVTISNTGTSCDEFTPLDQIDLPTAEYANSRPNFIGGQIFAGLGSTVSINEGSYTRGRSQRGGLIFNQGAMTISGGAVLSEGTARTRLGWSFNTGLGGGIYNAGDLFLDQMTLTGNTTQGVQGATGHPLKAEEYNGQNVYAYAPITITPRAEFDAGDIRVLDGQSWINLTGALNSGTHINVSISELAMSDGHGLSETPIRKIGYTVAKGASGYIPSLEDAKILHYYSNVDPNSAGIYNQPVATPDDHSDTGEWDFVLNPIDKTVVLGQRCKLIYHGNRNDHDPEQVSFNGNKGEDPTKDQLYYYFAEGISSYIINNKASGSSTQANRAEENLVPRSFAQALRSPMVSSIEIMSEAELKQDEEVPQRDKHRFKGWYNRDFKWDGLETEAERFKFEQNNPYQRKVTEIFGRPVIDIYAGWERPVKVRIQGLKKLLDKTDANAPRDISEQIKAEDYEFTLSYGAKGKTNPEMGFDPAQLGQKAKLSTLNQSGTKDGAPFVFDPILQFTQEGSYYFTVQEENKAPQNVSIDKKPHVLEIIIEKVEATGKAKVTISDKFELEDPNKPEQIFFDKTPVLEISNSYGKPAETNPDILIKCPPSCVLPPVVTQAPVVTPITETPSRKVHRIPRTGESRDVLPVGMLLSLAMLLVFARSKVKK